MSAMGKHITIADSGMRQDSMLAEMPEWLRVVKVQRDSAPSAPGDGGVRPAWFTRRSAARRTEASAASAVP